MIEFFMVWNEGGHSPTFKHSTIESAKQEAERLARKYGGEFHVLKSCIHLMILNWMIFVL